jgi:hypothetical protein
MSASFTITSPANANITDTATSISLSWSGATTGTNWRVEGVIIVNGVPVSSFNVPATATGTQSLAIASNQTAIYNNATGSSLTGAITIRANNYLDTSPFTLYTSQRTGGTLTIARRLTSPTNTTINPFNIDAFDGTSTYNFRAGWTRPHTAFRGRVSIYANGVLISTYSGFTTNMSRLPSSAELTAMTSAMGGVSPRNLYYVIETGFVANTTVYFTSGAITTPNTNLEKSFISPSPISIGNFTLSSATTSVPFTLTVGTPGATHTVELYIRVGGVDTLVRTHTGITGSGSFTIGTTERNIILDAMPANELATTWAKSIASLSGNTAEADSLATATTVLLGSEYVPAIGTITRAEANAYLATITSSNYFLTNKSNILFTMPATMARGATRASTRVQFAGTDATITGTGTTLTTASLQSAGTLNYTITITDSRGRSSVSTAGSIIVRAYTAPSIITFGANRRNSGDTANDPLGTRVRATFNIQAFSVLNSSNAEVNHIRWVIQYRLRPGGSWTSYSSNTSNTTLTLNTFSSPATTIPIANSYDFRIRAYDRFYDLNNNGALNDTDDFAESIVVLPFGKVSLMLGEETMSVGKVYANGTLDVGGEIYAIKSGGSSERVAMMSDIPDTSGFVPTSRTITAGNGLTGGGNLTANRTLTMGTPSTITTTSTNSTTATSHTHAIDFDVVEESGYTTTAFISTYTTTGSQTWWQKYSDGTLIFHGRANCTIAVTTSRGSGAFFSSSADGTMTIPSTGVPQFIDRFDLHASTDNTSGFFTWYFGRVDTSSDARFGFNATSSISSRVFEVHWTAIGRWKV